VKKILEGPSPAGLNRALKSAEKKIVERVLKFVEYNNRLTVENPLSPAVTPNSFLSVDFCV
jgi:hypothetical protein